MIKLQRYQKGFSAFNINDGIIASFHNERYLMAHHIHPFSELIYVLEGRIRVIASGKREYANKGDIAIIHSYQPHAYYTEEGDKENEGYSLPHF